jgi:hypothetical protein
MNKRVKALLRRVLSLAAVPLLLLGALVVTPGEASAAKWYCGSRCSGKDPSLYPPAGPCANDAVTVDSFSVRGRTVQMRYSNNCETIWARVYGIQDMDKIGVYNVWGDLENSWEFWEDPDTDTQWSGMFDDHDWELYFCLQRDWNRESIIRCGNSY